MEDANAQRGKDANATLQQIRDSAISTIMQDAKPDTELLEILKRHIVVSLPDEDAVERAAASIKRLAEERAES